MKPREFDILEAVISEYIESGLPVSSAHLFEKYDFGIRPAMIRAELNALEDEGFLEQPHHSAGRIPSDKALRHFAKMEFEKEVREAPREFLRAMEKRMWDEMAALLSSHLNVLAAVKAVSGDSIHKEGLQALVDHLEWQSRDEIVSIIGDFESLDRRLANPPPDMGDDFLEVFFGRESPITRSGNLTVIMGDYEVGDEKIFLCAIGPKRINFAKAADVFKGLKNNSKLHTNG